MSTRVAEQHAHDLPPARGQAVSALVLALIPLPPLWIGTLVLAIMVLTRPDDGRKRGKGIAVAALAMFPVWILVFVGVAFALDAADHVGRDDATGVVNVGGHADYADVRPGDCAQVPREAGQGIDLVPCWDPHLHEVLASFELPDGLYPGQDVVDTRAEEGCAARFTERVAQQQDGPALDVMNLAPVKTSWNRDRTVVCLIYALDGEPIRGTYPEATTP